jgi:glycosyltransferase involved in cell wall biosynthesis
VGLSLERRGIIREEWAICLIFPAAGAVPFQRRILAVGPAEGVVFGQSAAFLAYVRNSRHTISVVNTNDVGMPPFLRIVSSIGVIFLAGWHIFFRKPQCVYISTSRSKLGAVKDLAVITLARLMRVPVVNHLHGITFASFRNSVGPLYGSIIDWAYGYIAASIVLHEKLIPQYARYARMKVVVVNNFVDAQVATALRGKCKSAETINVLFLSNMIPEKGVFELIDAVKNVLAQYPGMLRLKIAGRFLPGVEMSSKEVERRLSGSIAAAPDIEYCGVADLQRKKALLEWAHVLALPSYMSEEAVPLVLLEGMSAGCYLVVSDFGVLPDLARDIVAAVVPARDTIALQNALTAVLKNPDILSLANRQNPEVAQRQYSEGQYVSGIDGLVDEFSAEK